MYKSAVTNGSFHKHSAFAFKIVLFTNKWTKRISTCFILDSKIDVFILSSCYILAILAPETLTQLK